MLTHTLRHMAAVEENHAGSRPASERACCDHACRTTWMAGTSPAMTIKSPYAIALCERPRGIACGPGALSSPVMAGRSPGHPRLCAARSVGRKTWMRGTDPRVQPGDAHDEEENA